MFEVVELVCGCCELGLWLAGLGEERDKRRAETEERAALRSARREEREGKRGVRLTFTGKRISDIEFLAGPAAGKRASALPDMELKRLALSMPNRVARFAIRRYLRHKKKGRFTAPAPVIKR
jgi:hypothetical protein